jgi:hypothetical protein
MYVKLANNQPSKFPYTLVDLSRDNPDTSFPADVTNETLALFGIYPVTATPPPEFDSKTHRVRQCVQSVNGAWTQVWHLQELPKQEAEDNVRGCRNRLLAACDWTQVSDAPVDQTIWAAYRQDLRDVTAQAGFPWNVEWPQQP